ncbi:hypothetical protein BURPS305_4040 [Burkholderia pseudomallei 305]|nr:hypothetical protein GBP346_A3404 [Burkholderia pseudomallei MSHR346]EBA48204.1 hypothetical protein BURPS305_4040 [Burkholderia pseudomallei 305]
MCSHPTNVERAFHAAGPFTHSAMSILRRIIFLQIVATIFLSDYDAMLAD